MKTYALLLLTMIVVESSCTQDPTHRSRKHVASLLSQEIGEAADPQVAFLRDSTHLLVDLSTAAFPTLAESTLTKRARGFAITALKNYDRVDTLDSISVVYTERLGHEGGWIRHIDAFSVAALRDLHPPNTR